MTWIGYTPAQWALFFYLYSFLGWVWESCYVSVRQRRWVNRGFLNGPLLPIYGFGALSVLVFTLPAAQNPALVFLFGMAGATLLEYVTGSVMEQMFHVRYWDYSMYRWNLNGYICLPASLCWGAFSLALIRIIHPAVSGLAAAVPASLAVPAVLVLTGLTAADALISLREAVDTRSILASLTESRRRIEWLQKRFEVQAAFAPNGFTRSVEAVERSRTALPARLKQMREARRHMLEALTARLDAQSLSSAHPSGSADSYLVQNELRAMESRTDSMYRRAVRHLRRSPGAVSPRYAEALRDVQSLGTL